MLQARQRRLDQRPVAVARGTWDVPAREERHHGQRRDRVVERAGDVLPVLALAHAVALCAARLAARGEAVRVPAARGLGVPREPVEPRVHRLLARRVAAEARKGLRAVVRLPRRDPA